MYDFKPAAATAPQALYRDLLAAAEALTADEPDGIANMANVAALLWEFLPDLNWAGFYRVAPDKVGAGAELVLGPFVGRPACIRIPFGRGVCGAAAESRATQLVEDVHAFPGHIACDSRSNSEIVTPVFDKSGGLAAVLDVDSTAFNAFDEIDQAGLEAICGDLLTID